MAVSEDSVEVQLRVGMLDLALAKLMTEDHHTIEFPTILLPENVEAGSIVRLQCSRALQAEDEDKNTFDAVQREILATFATDLPHAPVLRARNVTQTSVVLEWDPIQVASSDLHFVALYKGAQRLGLIPQPLKRTLTKVSNLEIDAPYDFRIVLSTSAGQFESNKLDIKTHKMTDLSGVVVCVGSLAHSDVTTEKINESLKRLGCVPPQDNVKLDTTHFICTTGGGAAFERAMDFNIPIVRPDWLQACENERRLVSVRGYYLSTDPAMYVNAKSAQEAQTPAINNSSEPAQEQHNQPPTESTEGIVSQEQKTDEHTSEELNGAVEPQENGQKLESSEALNIAEPSENHSAQDDEIAHVVEKFPESNSPEGLSLEAHSEGNTLGGEGQVTDETTVLDESSSNTKETQPEKGDEESKTIGTPDALSSHDELSEAVNNIGDQHLVEEKYETASSRQPHEASRSSEEHHAQVAEVLTDRELERELEEDPSAALHGGEKHNVVLEKSEAAEPQFADITEGASLNAVAEETNTESSNVGPSNVGPSNVEHSNVEHSNVEHSNVEHSNVEHSNVEHSNVEHSNVEPSNVEPSNAEEEKESKQAKSKKGKKNKKK